VVFDDLLLSIHPQSLEWTRTSSEQSLAQYCTILLEEHHEVALEIGWNLYLTIVSKTDQIGSVMLRSGDCAGQGS
jgi:hypothetical protein